MLTARSASVVGAGLPRPAVPPRQPTQGNWFAFTLLVVQQKNPVPSLQKTDVAVRLVSCHMTHASGEHKYTLHQVLKQRKILPHKVTSPAQAMRTLSIGKKVSQAWGPFLCGR